MEKTGSFEYTRKVLKEYRELTLNQLQELGGNPQLEVIVESLSKY
jgi:hypothetical protein